MKALVGSFNQEKALVEAFSVIVKTLFAAVVDTILAEGDGVNKLVCADSLGPGSVCTVWLAAHNKVGFSKSARVVVTAASLQSPQSGAVQQLLSLLDFCIEYDKQHTIVKDSPGVKTQGITAVCIEGCPGSVSSAITTASAAASPALLTSSSVCLVLGLLTVLAIAADFGLYKVYRKGVITYNHF